MAAKKTTKKATAKRTSAKKAPTKRAAAKSSAAKKTPGKAPAKKMSALDAAAKVLAEAGEPLRCKEIVETMLAKGYWTTNGQTPWATLYSAMLREIQQKGKQARFRKADRGLFALNK